MAIASPDAFEILKQPKAVTLTNLAANPSVDSVITGWSGIVGTGTSTITRDTGTFNSAPASAKCVHSATGSVGMGSPAINAVLGDYVEASFWINSVGAFAYSIQIIQATTATGFTGVVAQKIVTLPTTWQKISLGGVISSAVTSFAFIRIISNSATANTFYVDDITFVKNPSFPFVIPIDLATDTGLSSIILPGGEVSPVL